jgi:hypothetical protein
MPIDLDRIDAICEHLERVKRGERVKPLDVGQLTASQFAAINAGRSLQGLPTLVSAAIVYVGRHHFERRFHGDGYTILDMVAQLQGGLASTSVVDVGPRRTLLRSTVDRHDGYGNVVRDEVVLELMQYKPKAEVYNAIPKGDKNRPPKQKAPG